MPLCVVRNQSLADQVFEQLAREILLGHFAPGIDCRSPARSSQGIP